MKRIKYFLKNAKILTIALAITVDIIYYINPKAFEIARLEVKKAGGLTALYNPKARQPAPRPRLRLRTTLD